ncbi:MAG: NUDIX domain-containing protein [Gammaproteobacteria bacterium]|nr:NUDIX domain-containing protein [Gammaproteobacteria bacterium]
MSAAHDAPCSAGLLAFRRRGDLIEVFLVHPGGPLWRNKERHAWSIPKGEVEPNEPLLAAAQREFSEETGQRIDVRESIALTPRKSAKGKLVHAWAIEAECDAQAVRSNCFAMEWPPRSGRLQRFPEVDRAAWFDLETARDRLHAYLAPLLDELQSLIERGEAGTDR